MQVKQGLSQLDQKRVGILLIAILAIILISFLFAPISPVQGTITEYRIKKTLFYYKAHFASSGSGSHYVDYVNVTNYDRIGATLSVKMNKAYVTFSFRDGFGVTVEDQTTQSMFIAPKYSGIFKVPQSWGHLNASGSTGRTLIYEVTVPPILVKHNVTKTEYKSIINIIEDNLT